MKVKVLLFLLVLKSNCFCSLLYTQEYFIAYGVSFNCGTKINRLGLFVQGGLVADYFQLNIGCRTYYNLSTFGPSKPGFELQTNAGVLFGYGGLRKRASKFYSSIENQTLYKNSIAFSYNYYFDKQNTSQPTGLLALEFSKFSIWHENDLFGKSAADKYRTAAFKFAYTDTVFRLAVNVKMWTGDTKGQPRVRNNSYPARAGYIDMSEETFGSFSHGILSLQADYALPYSQFARIDMGIDSEKVRHVFQNKIIHDWIFIPENWLKPESYNLHIPMLDKNGRQYLFNSDQQIENTQFYINFSGNPGLFY